MDVGRLDDADEDFAGLTDAELVEIRQGTLDELEVLLPVLLTIHGRPGGNFKDDDLWLYLKLKLGVSKLSDPRELRFVKLRGLRRGVESEIDRRMGAMLQATRHVLGLTLLEVAKVAGIHSRFVDEIERGNSARYTLDRDLFKIACIEEGIEGMSLPLSRAAWLPLTDRRLCRTIRNVTVNPDWLASSEGAALVLARAIREGRSFDRLPELGDVLQTSGCDDRTILDHCQDPGLHAVGCWVVDALVRAGRST